MYDRIAFIKTGWMDIYGQGQIEARHDHIAQGNDGHEKYNYLPAPDGSYCVYVNHIGREYAAPSPLHSEKWLLIHVSAKNGTGPLTVVGWFEDATFLREYRNRPEYKNNRDWPLDNKGQHYTYCIRAQSGFQIPAHERNLIIENSKRHIGSASVVYVKGGESDEEWRQNYADQALEIISILKIQQLNSNQGFSLTTAEHKRQVEEAAIRRTKEHFYDYHCNSREHENCGYDLQLINKKTNIELHIEVKGTSLNSESFFISQNEYHSMKNDPQWRLSVVIRALSVNTDINIYNCKEAIENFDIQPVTYRAQRR